MILLQEWLDKQSSAADTLALTPANALAASLNRPALARGDLLPPLWHWLFFLPLSQHSQLGADGHTGQSDLLPPVPLPRRMWAGSRLQFLQGLRIGEAVRRESRILDIVEKKGRSGALVLVSVQHKIYGDNGLAITEEQDIVYRQSPSKEAFSTNAEPVAPVNPPAQNLKSQWSHQRSADTVLLFRYSALTFNSHRIHYDHPYTTQVEGYPDLIVHGPLLFTLLVDALLQEHPKVQIESLSVRAMRPLFCNQPFRLQGQLAPDRKQAQLWSLDQHATVTMHVHVALHTDEET
jgi:3-methylfumaryl-CoA hydratase